MFTSILITGASSGIGVALAVQYAAPGVRLALTGRDVDRLDKVAAQCRSLGAQVETHVLDVRDRDALRGWLIAQDVLHPIDLVIANAGISAGTGDSGETEDQARRIFAVNVDGVLNTLHPLIEPMKARRRGHLAIMSSMAAFRGLPGAPAYCASKAAVRVYGESLRGDLAPYGVNVSVVCPGFIETPMTAVNRFSMPFLMSAGKAAQIIQKGLAKNKPRIAFPWPTYMAVLVLSILPVRWVDRLLRLAPSKASE